MAGSPLSAALAVAREHGLPVDSAVVVRDLTNLLVHLAPAPVVARVPLTLSRLRGRDWYAQEVELGRFLAAAGAPVAPPTDSVDPGPHEHGGFLVSLWAHVEHDPGRRDPEAAADALRELHAALEGYPGPLPSCDRLDEIGRLLAELRPSPVVSAADLSMLRDRHAQLTPVRGRPIHGDAHLNNVLWSPAGPLWNDFENACAGPVEYDLACVAWRGSEEAPAFLAAYGAHDEDLRTALEPVLALFLAAWTIVIAERHPSAVEEARRRVGRALAYAREM